MAVSVELGIPTYNRSQYLRRRLEQVYSQINEGTNDIEVMVTENGVDLKTGSVCEKFLSKNNFSHVKFSENLGVERNLLNCFDRAQGDWIWILGDDDVINETAIDSVLEIIDIVDKKNPDAVFIHFDHGVVGNGKRFVENQTVEYDMRLTKIENISNLIKIRKNFAEMGLISLTLHRRRNYINNSRKFFEGCVSMFPHVYLDIVSLGAGGVGIHVDYPLILGDEGASNWSRFELYQRFPIFPFLFKSKLDRTEIAHWVYPYWKSRYGRAKIDPELVANSEKIELLKTARYEGEMLFILSMGPINYFKSNFVSLSKRFKNYWNRHISRH